MSNDAVNAINEWVEQESDEDSEYSHEPGWGEIKYRLADERTKYVKDETQKYGYRYEKEPNPPVVLEGLGRLVYVEGYTGSEGGGEDAYQVVKIVADDGSERFFRKQGYYASHYGTDWDGGLYEVVPYTKTVTFYDRRA